MRGWLALAGLVAILLLAGQSPLGPLTGDVPTIAALRGLAPGQYQVANVYGKNTLGDTGPSRSYIWSSSTCSAPDNVTQVPPGSGTGCWLLLANSGTLTTAAFGVVADNITDNSAALQVAFSWLSNNCQSALTFPTGTIYTSTASTLAIQAGCGVTIKGQGSNVSLVRAAAGVNFLNINTFNSRTSVFHIRDFSCLAGAPPQVAATCLNITQQVVGTGSIAQQSDITGMEFRGSDGYLKTNGWQAAVANSDFTNIDFINDSFFGTLAGYSGTETAGVGIFTVGPTGVPPQVAAQFVISGSTFEGLNMGVSYDFNVQGFTFTDDTFVLNNYGVFSPPTATQKAALQFNHNNCNNYVACVDDETTGGIPFAIYSDNIVFLQAGSTGFHLSGNNTLVHHNTFWGGAINNTSDGIVVYSGSVGPMVVDTNTIGQVAGTTMGVGIELPAFSENITLRANLLDPATITTPIINNSTFGNHNFIVGRFPLQAQLITGAASNGGSPNLTRITVGSTAGFITGDQVSINGLGGVSCNFITSAWVIDATRIDLSTCLFSGLYTSGGTISTMP